MSQELESDNIYAMSDEDLLKHDFDLTTQSAEEPPADTETVTEETPTTVPDETQTDDEVTTTEAEPEATEVASTADETTEPNETEAGTAEDVSEVDFKGFYEALTKPFNANGKEIQVTDPMDMIRLMQQGAGYHKKMEALKPLKRISKLLEDNNLLDETDLSYLIDIHQKKPEAIAKLIKDSGIDLFEFDLSKGEGNVPPQRSVDTVSVNLQTVLDDLKDNSPSYEQTINILGNQWDASSREVLAEHPELIRIIDSQVQDGTYEKVSKAVEYQRMLGNLNGVSDLQAYKAVGEQLFGTGAAQPQPKHVVPPVTLGVPPVTAAVSTTSTAEQRKKAAAAPRTSAAVPTQKIDPFAASDEDFMKALGTPNY